MAVSVKGCQHVTCLPQRFGADVWEVHAKVTARRGHQGRKGVDGGRDEREFRVQPGQDLRHVDVFISPHGLALCVALFGHLFAVCDCIHAVEDNKGHFPRTRHLLVHLKQGQRDEVPVRGFHEQWALVGEVGKRLDVTFPAFGI